MRSAPDLITLRGIETIRRVPVLASPRGFDYGASKAWEIVRTTIGEVPAQQRLFLTFPMRKDPERLRPAWERAFARIGAERMAETAAPCERRPPPTASRSGPGRGGRC